MGANADGGAAYRLDPGAKEVTSVPAGESSRERYGVKADPIAEDMVRFQRWALTQGARIAHGEYRTELLTGLGAARGRCEEELLAAGVGLPLIHRSAWTSAREPDTPLFLAVRNSAGKCECGFTLSVSKSQAWPGSVIARVERFGAAVTEQARDAGVVALATLARRNRKILRVNLEVFCPDNEIRKSIGETTKRLGFRRQDPPRSYPYTLAIDLRPEEDTLFSSLGKRARRGIRAADKKRVTILEITHERYASRLEELRRETFARTGGGIQDENWEAIIALSRTHPELSRLVGLFREDVDDPSGLLAFAWSRRHTDHVDYAAAASTRPEDIRIPLTFVLAWDLIRWGKRVGATWFDFGGVTGVNEGQDNRLKGISDFKRYFSKNVIPVGEEWVLEPRITSHLARAVSAVVGLLRRLA